MPKENIQPSAQPDVRGALRRNIRLKLPSRLGASPVILQAHNLSQTGLLAEIAAPVEVGDMLVLELPEVGEYQAQVVWKSGAYAGSNFAKPLPQSALSAALLKSIPANVPWDSTPGEVPCLHGKSEDDERLPLETRFGIIFGLALTSWLALGAALFLT